MSTSITLSAGVRQNLVSLQNIAVLMSTTQNRLATGKKVNSILDNPSSFFTAAALNNRANALNSVIDSVSNGIQIFAAANNGLTGITHLLESMQAVLNQAGPSQTNQAASYGIGSIDTSSVQNMSFTGGSVGSAPVQVALNTLGTATATSSSAGAQFSVIPGLNVGSPTTASSNVFSSAVVAATGQAQFTVDDSVINALADNTTVWVQLGSGQNLHFTKVSSANVPMGLFSTGAEFAACLADGTNGIANPVFGPTASVNYSAGTTTVTSNDVTDNFTFTDFTPTTSTSTGGDALTVSDGTHTSTFYKVASGASAAAGTYTTLDDLVNAINASSAGSGNGGGVTATNTGSGDAGTLHLTSTAGITVGGAAATELGLTVTPAVAAGTGAGFSIAVNGGGSQAISVSPADVSGGSDLSNGGNNSVNLAAAINAKLIAAGINNVQAVKSGAAGVSAASDTISLQATAPGSGTTFSLSGITGGVIGGSVTAGTDGGAVKTVDQLVSDINTNAVLTGKVHASNAGGKLSIENISGNALTVTGVTGGNIDGSGATTTIAGTSAGSLSSSLATQFNGLSTQIDMLAGDSSFNGVNLLNGDNLNTLFNEQGTSSLSVTGVTLNSTGLGLIAPLDSNSNADTQLATLKAALDTVSLQASRLGSYMAVMQTREDFTKNMVNTLQTGADNLVLADPNQEGANLLALQTRQSLSSTALSLASKSGQAVLRLFG